MLIRIGVGSGRVGRAMALPKISPSPFKLRQNQGLVGRSCEIHIRHTTNLTEWFSHCSS